MKHLETCQNNNLTNCTNILISVATNNGIQLRDLQFALRWIFISRLHNVLNFIITEKKI